MRPRAHRFAFWVAAIAVVPVACAVGGEDSSPTPDTGVALDVAPDLGARRDTGTKQPDAGPVEASDLDSGAPEDTGSDTGTSPDAGVDAGLDSGVDAGVEAGKDAGPEAGADTGTTCSGHGFSGALVTYVLSVSTITRIRVKVREEGSARWRSSLRGAVRIS